MALPFKRGTTQSAPGLEGLRLYDDDKKQWLIIAKNTNATALSGKTLVKWEDPENYEVDAATAEGHGPIAAGVVDPELSATVPVNRHFYVVQKGICTCQFGSTGIAAVSGSLLFPSPAGKVQALTDAIAASAALGAIEAADLLSMQHIVGVSHAAAAATTVVANIQMLVDVRGA